MDPRRSSTLLPYLGHPDFEALVAGVGAAPKDNAPRLVLSDWIRDHGDDLAADMVAEAGRHFPTLLSFARCEKATGRTPAELILNLATLFTAHGRQMAEALGPAIMRASESMQAAVQAMGQAFAAAQRQAGKATKRGRALPKRKRSTKKKAK